MGFQGDIGTHLWLTRGMAERLGVALDRVLHDGTLTRDDFAGLVTRCSACGQPGDCVSFQMAGRASSAAGPAGRGSQAPAYCGNRALFDELRALGA